MQSRVPDAAQRPSAVRRRAGTHASRWTPDQLCSISCCTASEARRPVYAAFSGRALRCQVPAARMMVARSERSGANCSTSRAALASATRSAGSPAWLDQMRHRAVTLERDHSRYGHPSQDFVNRRRTRLRINFTPSGNALLTKKLYHLARPRKGLGHAHFPDVTAQIQFETDAASKGRAPVRILTRTPKKS